MKQTMLGRFIAHTEEKIAYTTKNLANYITIRGPLIMLQKALEERTKISCTAVCWKLVCTLNDVQQDAHVDLGASIYHAKRKLG